MVYNVTGGGIVLVRSTANGAYLVGMPTSVVVTTDPADAVNPRIELDFARAVQLLHPAQAQLGREINPKVFSAAEFASAADGPFLRDVLGKPKIFLLGDERELEELGRRQP